MKMGIDIDEEIEHFFEPPPAEGPGDGPTCSILFLLRRDLRDLTGQESKPESRELLRTPILASFGIMIGLELLARVWLGENDPKRPQLKKAFQEILEVDSRTADLMTHFRDAIGHGYQLSIHARDRKEYHFAVDDSAHVNSSFFEPGDATHTHYTIQFWTLRAKFLNAIQKVRATLANPGNDQHRMHFYAMIPYLRPYEIRQSYGFKPNR